jgi:hypothetical protein
VLRQLLYWIILRRQLEDYIVYGNLYKFKQ